MITVESKHINPTTKAPGTAPVKSHLSRRVKFSATKKTSAKISCDKLTDIASMLFLQEVDSDKQEKERLRKLGRKALKALRRLQLDLLSEQVDPGSLYELRDILGAEDKDFYNEDIAETAAEILLRVEIEIAKIECAAAKIHTSQLQ